MSKEKRKKTQEELKLLEGREKKFVELLNLIKSDENTWAGREKALGAYFNFHPSTLHNVRLGRLDLARKATNKMKRILRERRGIVDLVLDFSILERKVE